MEGNVKEASLSYEQNNYEIIIVDNNSTDGTKEWLEKQENIKFILNEENKGFIVACNEGIEAANKDNDIFLYGIELKVEEEKNKKLLIDMVSERKIDVDIILDIIEHKIINKVEVLNILAIEFFKNEFNDLIIPMLTAAYGLDSTNIDTNYNLAYILFVKNIANRLL